ncbi:MAG TPA: pitrilysin family protein [Solirubrobacteraceae bacterium]|nr:pitrilysin family protein [Solirubrobacteraceae bacterium]
MSNAHVITELPGGVRVVTERVPAVRSVALGFWIGSGSCSESDAQAGLSHLLEHMLFRGTERYASEEIDQIFDAMGAELNAATGKEMTSLYARVLDEHLERAFDVIVQMVAEPTMHGLAEEREVVLEEIAMYEDDPQDLIFDVLGETIFPDNPLGRATLGRAEVVSATTREELLSFHGERYAPGNIVIAAAGSVEHERIVAWAGDALASLRPAVAPDPVARPVAPASGAASTRFRVRDTEQYHLTLGAIGLAREDDRRFALRVLDSILGGTSSSRLFQAVREQRGLAYSVFTFQSLFKHTGEVGLYVGTRPENLAEVCEVLAVELERIREEPVSAEELERAKENVKGRIVLALESTSARMDRLGSAVLAGMPILELDETIARIEAVDDEQVGALAAELLVPERLCAAAIGPDEDVFRAAIAPLMPALAEAP